MFRLKRGSASVIALLFSFVAALFVLGGKKSYNPDDAHSSERGAERTLKNWFSIPGAGGPLGPQDFSSNPLATKSDIAAMLTSGQVVAAFPADRCKQGMLLWKEGGKTLSCPVMGRGESGSVGGTRSDGSHCSYAPASVTNGATPVGHYKIYLEPGHPKQNTNWGGLPPTRMENAEIQYSHRNGMLIHSDHYQGRNLEYRPTWGCIKIDHACQVPFNDWMQANGYTSGRRKADLRVVEI